MIIAGNTTRRAVINWTSALSPFSWLRFFFVVKRTRFVDTTNAPRFVFWRWFSVLCMHSNGIRDPRVLPSSALLRFRNSWSMIDSWLQTWWTRRPNRVRCPAWAVVRYSTIITTTTATTITTARLPSRDIFILNTQIRRLRFFEKRPSDIEFIIRIRLPLTANYFTLCEITFHKLIVARYFNGFTGKLIFAQISPRRFRNVPIIEYVRFYSIIDF